MKYGNLLLHQLLLYYNFLISNSIISNDLNYNMHVNNTATKSDLKSGFIRFNQRLYPRHKLQYTLHCMFNELHIIRIGPFYNTLSHYSVTCKARAVRFVTKRYTYCSIGWQNMIQVTNHSTSSGYICVIRADTALLGCPKSID